MELIFIILTTIGLILFGVSIIILLNKKKRVYIPVVQESEPIVKAEVSHPNVIIKNPDRVLYEQFMQEYDSGDFKFSDISYRPGSTNTCPFGIAEGFKYFNGKMVWGYVRLHTGVDKARAQTVKGIKDIVRVPFDFDKSQIIEYKQNGKFYGYGTLILLTNTKYAFQMRIAHMDPSEDIIPWSYDRLRKGLGFQRGWLLGSAGTLGDSSAAHTHTEILSLDDSAEVLDILLEEQYGDKALIEYSKADILREYRKYSKFSQSSDTIILKDWAAVKADRGAMFANKYKYKFKTEGGSFTRYASNLLFSGL